MSQKVPFGGGQARWYANATFTAAVAAGAEASFLLLPSRAAVYDPTTSLSDKVWTAAAGSATTIQINTGTPWITNQWAGYWVYGLGGGGAGARQKVVSNTNNTLTVANLAVAWGATSVVTLVQDGMWGTAYPIGQSGSTTGTPSGAGSSTTLVDSTQSWRPNQFQDYEVQIVAGTDAGQKAIITSNTATTLTFAPAMTGSTDATSLYQILEPAGYKPVLTDYEVGSAASALTTAGILKIESVNLLGTASSVRTLVQAGVGNATFCGNCELFRPGGANHLIRVTLASFSGTAPQIGISLGGYWIASGSAEGNAL